jgi:trk system potassium uptake protein TrkA
MLAKIYRVEKVVARVNHPSNEWLYDKEWGVDAAMSSPAVLHGHIEKDLGLGDLITLLKLQTDGVAVEEITLPETAAAVGRRIDGVSLPSNVTIMAILSVDRGVQAARDEYVLGAGDQLLLLVEGALEGAEIRESFGIAEP